MDSCSGIATVWMGLALVASFLSIRYKLSVALVQNLVGIMAGNLALVARGTDPGPRPCAGPPP
jgi:hypothetical protein